ncbi:MAG: hypothetical protein KTV77_02215 [Wolbachia endosymbiont of Fragariocoptes setiger]|nr:hypothetical protein [Wolbachia endosymbiont of Fragariocoptes setiger]
MTEKLIYVFENRDRWASYVKKWYKKQQIKSLAYQKWSMKVKGLIYIYIDHRGNIIKDTLEHEIGHAMNFINLINFDHFIPQAMHEAIANYMEGRENNESSNTFMDREALLEIKDKSLVLDEILRKNLVGNYYYSEAEQVIKFLEDKHPSLIDDLFKKLSIMNNSSTDFKEYSQDEAGKVMTDFFNQLKSYRSEFRDWVEEEIKSQYDDQKGHQSSDRVSRNIKVDVQPEDERSESIILKDTILKIERSCDNDLQGKCEAKLIIDYSTMKSLYDQAEGIDINKLYLNFGTSYMI